VKRLERQLAPEQFQVNMAALLKITS